MKLTNFVKNFVKDFSNKVVQKSKLSKKYFYKKYFYKKCAPKQVFLNEKKNSERFE